MTFNSKKTGKMIKKLRIEAKMSKIELANRVGISRQTLDDYEKGTYKDIGVDRIISLAEIFGVSVDYLLGLSDVSSVDLETKAICENIGISEYAYKRLKEIRSELFDKVYLDSILENIDFGELNSCISAYVHFKQKMSPRIDREKPYAFGDIDMNYFDDTKYNRVSIDDFIYQQELEDKVTIAEYRATELLKRSFRLICDKLKDTETFYDYNEVTSNAEEEKES